MLEYGCEIMLELEDYSRFNHLKEKLDIDENS
jgi:hypothetical protein